MTIEAYFDGACEPMNPGGIATCGWLIYRGGQRLTRGAKIVCRGEGATNNVAEYHGLLMLLQALATLRQPGEEIIIRGDSQLVIRQMEGTYGVHAPLLVPLYQRAQALITNLHPLRYEWVPRERNAEADRLSRFAYERACGRA